MSGQPNHRDRQVAETGAATGLISRLGAVANRRALSWAVLAVICALVAVRAMQPIANTDLGWHLALGRYIVESGAIPDAEPFTHTARGAPMVAHEWLSQAIYHGVVQLGGLLSLRALHAALAVGILLWIFALLLREKVPPAFALLGVFLYVTISQARSSVL